jgi:hypothetical protein
LELSGRHRKRQGNAENPQDVTARNNQMIRQCRSDEFGVIGEIINDAAQAYRGVIPEDRWHEPYMSPPN